MMKKALSLSLTLGLLTACGDDGNDASTGNESIGSADSVSGDGDGDSATDGTGDGDATETESNGDGDGDGDGDSGDSGDGDGDGDDGCGDENCGCVEVTIPAIPPNVMLILDKSGSMFSNEVDDGMGGMITRWNSLHNVVTNVTAANDVTLNLGAQLFPQYDAAIDFNIAACNTLATPEVLVDTMNGSNIIAAIPGPTAAGNMVGGATPAYAGLDSAYNHLASLDAEIPKYAIFITDGAANCRADLVADAVACGGDFACSTEVLAAWETFDDTLVTRVGQAFSDEITTFVVGIGIVDFDPNSGISCTSDADCSAFPGTACCGVTPNLSNCPQNNTCGYPFGNPKNVNAADELAAIAMAGGAPNLPPTGYYDGSDQAQLQAALDEIGGLIPTCTLTLDPAPAANQIDRVTLTINGANYGFCFDTMGEPLPNCSPILADAAACATGDGFYWSVEHTEVTLCGAACESFKTNGELDAAYGCPEGG